MTPTLSKAQDEPPVEPVHNAAGALAAAITRDWRPYRWRAYAIAVVAAITVGGICVPIVTSVLAIALALGGVTIDPRLPWAEITWSAAFVVTFAAVGAWAVVRWLPSDFRAATETYVWLATRAEAQWHTIFGDRPVPRSRPALQRFVDETPESSETAGERVAAWLGLGNMAAARRVITQMPADTAVQRQAIAGATWLVAFIGGTVGDLAPLRAGVAEIDDPLDHLDAEVELAVNAARVALAEGRDWKPPLAEIRGHLGTEPEAMLWRLSWRPVFGGMLVAGIIGVAAFWLFTAIS
jgi:hypothetical protein